LLPKPGFLAQMSQTAATGYSWNDRWKVGEPAERATGTDYPSTARAPKS
jgi:hypothetical protein